MTHRSSFIQFFSYEHLPEHLKQVSKPFHDLAEWIDHTLPDNPEKTTALRKLVEAKDCAIRAVLFKAILDK
jgi:ferritin-like protein